MTDLQTHYRRHRYMHADDILTHRVSTTFLNNSKETISAAKFIYGILCFAPRGFFSLLFSPSFSYSVLFPAALLSLSFTLLHLSFWTHSWGVRLLQLVHISTPHFTHTPPFPSLCTPSLFRSLPPPPPPPLPHADLCLSWLALGASMSREEWVDSHSLM